MPAIILTSSSLSPAAAFLIRSMAAWFFSLASTESSWSALSRTAGLSLSSWVCQSLSFSSAFISPVC